MLVIIVGAIAYNTYVAPVSVPSFGNDYGGGGQGATVTDQPPVVISEKANLGAVFQPYMVSLDVYNSCNLFGGTIYETANKVGCFDMAIAINTSSTCTSAAYLASSHQCYALGATPVCNEYNLGCMYG